VHPRLTQPFKVAATIQEMASGLFSFFKQKHLQQALQVRNQTVNCLTSSTLPAQQENCCHFRKLRQKARLLRVRHFSERSAFRAELSGSFTLIASLAGFQERQSKGCQLTLI